MTAPQATVRTEFTKLQGEIIPVLDTLMERVKEVYSDSPDVAASITTSIDFRKNSIQYNEFVVVVTGELNRGKSTFLNALLRDLVLVPDVSEATATVAFLRHNDTAEERFKGKAVVHYKDGRDFEIIEKNLEVLKKYTARQSENGQDYVAETIDHVDVYADSIFLKDNVTIVDTPGVNSVHPSHMKITARQIDRSHAAIHLFAAGQAFTASESDFLTEMKRKIKRFFLVINRIDEISFEDQDRVKNDLKDKASKFLGFSAEGKKDGYEIIVYGLSGLKALLGRIGYFKNEKIGEEEKGKLDSLEYRIKLVKESKIEVIERDLEEYLFRGEKAKDILSSTTNFAHEQAIMLENYLYEQKNMAEGKSDFIEMELQVRELEREVENKKNELKATTDSISSKLEIAFKNTVDDAKFMLTASEAKLQDKLNRYSNIEFLQNNWDEGDCISMFPSRELSRISVKIERDFEDLIETTLRAEDRRIRGKIIDGLQGKVKFKLPELPEINIKIREPKIDKNKMQELTDMDNKIRELNERIAVMNISDMEDTKAELRRCQTEKDTIEANFRYKMQQLGTAPAIDRFQEEILHKEWRGGIWGGFKNIFVGRKIEKINITKTSDTANKQYHERLESLEKTHADKQKKIEETYDVAKAKYSKAKADDLKKKAFEKEMSNYELEKEKVLKQTEDKIKKMQEAYLESNKQLVVDSFERVKDDVVTTVENLVKSNKKIALDFVESIIQQLDESTQKLESELATLRMIKESKQTEKEDIINRISSQLTKVCELKDAIINIDESINAHFLAYPNEGGTE